MAHKFRKGDVVSVEMVVEYGSDQKLKLVNPETYTTLYIDENKVTLVRPHFNVGERIVFDNGMETPISTDFATILAVNNEWAWVKIEDDGGYDTWLAANICLAPKTLTETELVDVIDAITLPEAPNDGLAPDEEVQF